MSNFAFLQSEWPGIHESAARAEASVYADPRAACFYARRTLELVVKWVYAHDREVKLPYQDHLIALIHEPSLREVAGPAVFTKAKLFRHLGNQAVHSTRPIRQYDALTAARELFPRLEQFQLDILIIPNILFMLSGNTVDSEQ